MLLKDLIEKKNNREIEKLELFKIILKKDIEKNYNAWWWIDAKYFSYIFSTYYNNYPHLRHKIYNPSETSLQNIYDKFKNINCKNITKNKNHSLNRLYKFNKDKDVNKILLDFFKKGLEGFIKKINIYLNPNIRSRDLLYINPYELNCVIDFPPIMYLPDFSTHLSFYKLKRQYCSNNMNINFDEEFTDFCITLESLNIYFITNVYSYIMKDGKNIENDLNFDNVVSKMLTTMYDLKNIKTTSSSNKPNGVIFIKKIGPVSFLDSNGNIEPFNKNRIKDYLNYNVQTEITSKSGTYAYLNFIFNLSDI